MIRACAPAPETWISEEIIRSYRDLHMLGYAHSVECWLDDELVGGLVRGGAGRRVFRGIDVPHRDRRVEGRAGALVERLRVRGYTLLDIQWTTPHLKTFGAQDIPRAEYLQRLATALGQNREFS